MLIHRFMDVRFDLKIFFDPISFKKTTLMEHLQLSKFMLFKIRAMLFCFCQNLLFRVWICKFQFLWIFCAVST